MGPKAASYDDKLLFVLQCLHSIKDASGNPAKPDFRALEPLLNLKHNSLYVRYRGIVNKEIEKGAVGIYPVGSKAIANASGAGPGASKSRNSGSKGVPTFASITNSKPVKKRKNSPEPTDTGTGTGEDDYGLGPKRKKIDSAVEVPSLPSVQSGPDDDLFEDFSDVDAEGEPDDEY